MNGTAFGLVVGLVYGAILGVYAYRWYERQRSSIDGRHEDLRESVRNLARELHALKHPEVAA